MGSCSGQPSRGVGRLIKGLYYSDSLKGPHALAAFFIVDRLLEPKPFLMMDFRSHQFSFDRNSNT